MNNALVIILPLLLFVVLWIVFAQVRRAPLQASTHFGLVFTLMVLTVFGLWTLISSNGGGFSGLVIYVWIAYGIPVAVVAFLFGSASYNLVRTKQLWRSRKSRSGRHKVVLSIIFIVSFLVIFIGYFYVENLESRFTGQEVSETSLRHLYHNPVVRIFPHLRARLAGHRSIPLDILAKLFDDSNNYVWWVSCKNDKATQELLRKASKSSWPQRKQCVLANPNAPIELLREWSGDTDDLIRSYVARHKNTPPDVLLLLSSDDSQSVQVSVANNAASPGEALTRLANSDNPWQRGNVASHVNTPASVLKQLTKDPDPKVRLDLVFRVQLPLHIIETLLNDTNEEVQAGARSRLRQHERQKKVDASAR